MAELAGSGGQTLSAETGEQNYAVPLIWLTTLFFMWGFLTSLNDILIPHLKSVFDLNYVQAMAVQFCFFMAYFIVSIPAGLVIRKVGYKRGISIGLAIAALGCLLFYPAGIYQVYAIFLGALFILAGGITVLQVAANPYVTILGRPETSSSRLNMTQAFNSLGTVAGPEFGRCFIMGSGVMFGLVIFDGQVDRTFGAEDVQIPYLYLSAALLGLGLIFALLKLPKIVDHDAGNPVGNVQALKNALSFKHLTLGAVAIFLYVGAEVATGSFFVNYLAEPSVKGFTETVAAGYLKWFWGGAMVGRIIGFIIMTRLPAGKILAFNSVAAVVLLALVITSSGDLAMYSIIGLGLCNSIMFPTIFSLAVKKLGPWTSVGSSILCLAIVGGAVVPMVQGAIADIASIRIGFILPLACYLYIAFYGVKGHKLEGTK